MSFAHFVWLATGSTLRPMTFVLRLSNSGFSFAMYPSSVVQTGVKSFGCEKRMAQPFPIQSWKLTFPWVVSAVKLGASALMRSDIGSSGERDDVPYSNRACGRPACGDWPRGPRRASVQALVTGELPRRLAG